MGAEDLDKLLLAHVYLGSEASILRLIREGANPNWEDQQGWRGRTLHMAAQRGYPEICKLLINAGADVHATDVLGRTALHVAAGSTGPDVCRVLIAGGADPRFFNKASSTKAPPFQVAVEIGRVETVAYFIDECGEDPQQKTIYGRSMLQLASRRIPIKELLRARIAEITDPDEDSGVTSRERRSQKAPSDDLSGPPSGSIESFWHGRRSPGRAGPS